MDNPFTQALAQLPNVGPARHDPHLPGCPVCGAPALLGYQWLTWSDLEHDCDCILTHDAEHTAGLLRLHRERMALPNFMANLPQRYKHYTLANAPETPHHVAALKAARQLDGRWLYIHGPAGAGKTHIAVGAARAYAEMGRTARYWSVNELVAVLRDAAFDRAPRPDLLSADVLVLDDAGKLKSTPFAYEQLYNTLEGRWAREKTTIITANHPAFRVSAMLTPEGNEDSAAALASRMGSGYVLPISQDAPDGRFKEGGTL